MGYSEIISILRDDFREKGYGISDTCDKFPYLPVDIFCTVSTEGGKNEYWFVLIASIDQISNDFQKMLDFYRYYIQTEYEPSEYRVILVVPETATVDKTPYYAEGEEKEDDFYKVNGFGLWTISGDGKIDDETYPAITLSDKIAKDYQALKDRAKSMKRMSKILPEEFADGYIHFSVKAIVDYYDTNYNVKFKERYLDSNLLEKILKLRNISYKEGIYNLVNAHLSKKTKSDFDFCTDTFNKLWAEKLGEEMYPQEHKNLETLLVQIYPEYRDHYIHQLQVFYLGLLIIDFLIDNNKMKSQNGFPDLAWLLAASFHDYAHPIEKYDNFVCKFVNKCLSTNADWSFLGLKDYYHEQSFSSDIEHVLSSLTKCFRAEAFQGEKRTDNYNKVRQFFYQEITKGKNHGLVACLGLIKKFMNNPDIDFYDVLLPAAVAIALHDDKICQPLHGVTNNTTPESTSIQELAPLQELSFEAQPLAFLLILCDNIQDWGRHYMEEKYEKPLRAANIRLGNIKFESNTLTIQLLFNHKRESLDFMYYKKTTLEKFEHLLASPDVEFVIEYWDRAKNELSPFVFHIGGKKETSANT